MGHMCCRYALPLAELGGDFYDELKSLSSGYASFDYAEGPSRRADLVRVLESQPPCWGAADTALINHRMRRVVWVG